MSQNHLYKFLLIIWIVALNITSLEAKVHKPKGKEDKIKLRIKDKNRTYYQLDHDGLVYKYIGSQKELIDSSGLKNDLKQIGGDSIRIGIYSRTIKAPTGRKERNYGFTIQIDNGKPQKLKFKKVGSKVTSKDRPGWNYTESGIWYIYLPINQKGYKISIKPVKGNPVVYLRLTSRILLKEGNYGNILRTLNDQKRWRIQTDKKTNPTYWYPLEKHKQQQYEIVGPASIRIFTRLLFEDNLTKTKDEYYIKILEDGFENGTYYLNTIISDVTKVVKTDHQVGRWRSIWLNVPRGTHYYTLLLPDIGDNLDKTVYIRIKEWEEQ